MFFLKIWLCFTFFFATELAWSGQIKFAEIANLIEQSNKKLKSFDSIVQSEEKKTGFLARSFIPNFAFFAGQESFHADRLGDQSTTFYGIEAKANIFNGMGDYWEEKKRESKVSLAKIERRLGASDLIFEARKTYLELAQAKIVKRELVDSLTRLDDVFRRVQRKVRGGVVSGSDLTSLRLVQVEFEHEAKDLAGEIVVWIASLKTLLGISDLKIEDIDESVLTLASENAKKTLASDSAAAAMYAMEADIFSSEAKVVAGEKLPTIHLFANYGRRPFSEREFTEKTDREDWAAGVQLTWKVGQILESNKQESGAQLRASAAENLREYHSEAIKNRIESLEQKKELLAESVRGLENEINLSQNYYTQVSSEYLRGVKSTSDLTSTFSQLLEIKKHRVELIVQFQLAIAEIKRLIGENDDGVAESF